MELIASSQRLKPHFILQGSQEFVTFISKFEILLRRLQASWMDTMPAPTPTQEFHGNLADYNRIGNARGREECA